MTSADQFKVIDPSTFEVTLPKPDKLALPNLATVYPIIINSKLAKANATAEDPWAIGWLKEHTAGSGAYIDRKLQAGRTGDHEAQRGLESRHARQIGVLQAGDRADGAGAGDPRQSGRARRRRHHRRFAGQRHPVAGEQGHAEGDLDAAI